MLVGGRPSELNTSPNAVKSAADWILNRARRMQECLSSQVQAIVGEVLKLKDAAAKD